VTIVIYCFALSDVAYVQVAFLCVYDSARWSVSSGLRTILFMITWDWEPLSGYVIGPQLDHVQLNWSRQIRPCESRGPWPGQLHSSYKSMEQGHRVVMEAVAGALLTCRDTDCIRITHQIIWILNKSIWIKLIPI